MTNPPDGERLRDSWQALAEDVTGTPQVDHEAVWRAVAGEGTTDQRLAVVDVVARDPATAESWRLAQELQRELTEREASWPTAQLGETPVVTPFRRHQWIALAAILFLALGLGFWRFVGSSSIGPAGPVFREAPTTELLSQVPEDVAQPPDSLTLSWTDAGAEAHSTGTNNKRTHYTLRVLRQNLKPLIVLRELTSSSVRIPAERLSEIAAGERLLWQVEAHRPDGQIVTSQTFFLSLVPTTKSSTSPKNPQQEEP